MLLDGHGRAAILRVTYSHDAVPLAVFQFVNPTKTMVLPDNARTVGGPVEFTMLLNNAADPRVDLFPL